PSGLTHQVSSPGTCRGFSTSQADPATAKLLPSGGSRKGRTPQRFPGDVNGRGLGVPTAPGGPTQIGSGPFQTTQERLNFRLAFRRLLPGLPNDGIPDGRWVDLSLVGDDPGPRRSSFAFERSTARARSADIAGNRRKAPATSRNPNSSVSIPRC